jgi:hypothetical protein
MCLEWLLNTYNRLVGSFLFLFSGMASVSGMAAEYLGGSTLLLLHRQSPCGCLGSRGLRLPGVDDHMIGVEVKVAWISGMAYHS